MENILLELINYLWTVIKITTFQLLILFGPLLLLALIIHFFSKRNQIQGIYIFGEKTYIYGFAWLGTAVHELGHAFFAIIFGHKIIKIKLFSPDADGTLGYVEHSYNPRNFYHRIGNFFIGIGPIIFGSLIMYTFLYFVFENRIDEVLDISFNINSLQNIDAAKLTIISFLTELRNAIISIYNMIVSYGWFSIIIIYVLYSIVSSISLSSSDIKGSKDGLIFFVILLFVINTATLWFSNVVTSIVLFLSGIITEIYIMLILGIVINILFFIVLFLMRIIKTLFT